MSIWSLIPWEWAAGAIAALVAGLGVYFKGRSDSRARADRKQAKANDQAHERMNNADTLRDATDDDRVKRLRDFAERNRRP